MEKSFLSALQNFLKEEKIKMKLRELSNSEFWLESLDGLITVKLVIDNKLKKIFFDIFSTKYDVHLKEETLKDVEDIDYVAEEKRDWKLEEKVENVWLILDEIKLWARKNNFEVQEKEMI